MEQGVKCVIIGAGPTGLAAAFQLEKTKVPWALFEAREHAGGLAASFHADGFTWDLGGHVIFSHYRCFDNMLDSLLDRAEWLHHERRAFIRILDRWVPYPFQNNIRHLPEREMRECLAGLEKARVGVGAEAPEHFEQWISRNVGDGIARLFMLPYNSKVWACAPRVLSASWLGDRVAVPDVERIRRNIAQGTDDVAWGPNNMFRFPVSGGTGEVWRRLAAGLPAEKIHYGHEMTGIDTSRRRVSFRNGHVEPYDVLVNTSPLDKFVEAAGLAEIASSTADLIHTSVHVVGVGLIGRSVEARDKCWLYFPEREYPFYRTTVFSNYSAANVPEGCYSLMAEVSESAAEPVDANTVAERCIEGLRRCGLIEADGKVVHVWQRRLEYAYPVPSLRRDDALNAILPALEKLSIYSRGRFGAWKYEVGNMDHSFLQGIELANRIAYDTPETTLHCPSIVNAGTFR